MDRRKDMVRVIVHLHGELKNRFPISNTLELDVESYTTLDELIGILHLTYDEVIVTLVNGKACGLEYNLVDGDRLDIFPPLAGG